MTERTAEMLAWVERLPRAQADEISSRVLWELQADAEHDACADHQNATLTPTYTCGDSPIETRCITTA